MITVHFISKEQINVDDDFVIDINSAAQFITTKDIASTNDIIINKNNIEYIVVMKD